MNDSEDVQTYTRERLEGCIRIYNFVNMENHPYDGEYKKYPEEVWDENLALDAVLAAESTKALEDIPEKFFTLETLYKIVEYYDSIDDFYYDRSIIEQIRISLMIKQQL